MFDNYNPITNIYSVFDLKLKQEFRKNNTSRFFYALSIRIEGKATMIYKNKQITLNKNDIFFAPKFLDYDRHSKEDETIICVHFDMTKEDIIPESFTPTDPYVFIRDFQHLYNVWQKKDTGYMFEAISILNKILKNICYQKECTSINTSLALIQPALNYIKENFQTAVFNVKSLAEMCRISVTYLRRLFNKHFGISPIKYINNLKLEYATELLMTRYYTIEEVSEKCGIPNSKYFAILYKEKYGVSPSKIGNY